MLSTNVFQNKTQIETNRLSLTRISPLTDWKWPAEYKTQTTKNKTKLTKNKAINSLRHNNYITIKPAGKSSDKVIMEKSVYMQEGLWQLSSDTNFYEEVQEDCSGEVIHSQSSCA